MYNLHMHISNTYWCILCLLLLVPTSSLHLIHIILISLFTGLDMWWCWQQLCHTFMCIVTDGCEHIMQLPNNTSMFLGGQKTVWWIGSAVKNVKIISNRCRAKSFYVRPDCFVGEQICAAKWAKQIWTKSWDNRKADRLQCYWHTA